VGKKKHCWETAVMAEFGFGRQGLKVGFGWRFVGKDNIGVIGKILEKGINIEGQDVVALS